MLIRQRPLSETGFQCAVKQSLKIPVRKKRIPEFDCHLSRNHSRPDTAGERERQRAFRHLEGMAGRRVGRVAGGPARRGTWGQAAAAAAAEQPPQQNLL